ncbi:MAG: hypothetical protein IKU90_04555 [Clostridia bacterium]|nr:hypothetical protein [Clostridia bacterium]
MTYKFYNAHPYKLSVDDCVKRSVALTTGIDYPLVQKGLNEHKKITGAKRFYDHPNPRSYMENVLGFKQVAVPPKADGTKPTVGEFAASHPCGRYVLSLSGHWTACIDGIVYDTWDCRDKRVLSYYEVTRFKRTLIEKKHCFTQTREAENRISVAVYDGNGNSVAKLLGRDEARDYAKRLLDRGYFNFDEMGEFT